MLHQRFGSITTSGVLLINVASMSSVHHSLYRLTAHRVQACLQSAVAADCRQTCALIDGIEAENLLADKGCDMQEIIDAALHGNMKVVIPPKRNRKEQREYDFYLYRRHVVENAFLHLKHWCGIATRYAERASSFLAAVQIFCIDL